MFVIMLFFAHSKLCGEIPNVRVWLNDSFRGEIETANRIKKACENLGWNVVLTDISEMEHNTEIYDINFTAVPNKVALTNQADYLLLLDPIHHYFDIKGHLLERYASYTGFLAIYKNRDLLTADLSGDTSRIYEKPWYPTAQFHPYREVNPDHIFYVIATWGKRRFHPKYAVLQQLLAKAEYSAFYGSPDVGQLYGDTYKGDIPFDGVSLIRTVSDSGVCLVLHSETHLKHKIPSGRIFEGAAASAVIICDRNKFVMDNFGDSVLYVDESLPAQKLFNQIDAHMKWIRDHKEEALKMARRAHQIFEEKFTLEQHLLEFLEYHQNRN